MNFTDIVNNARHLNLTRQRIGEEFRHAFGKAAFAREFQTVRLGLGRQIGETSYVFNNAGPLDLVIVSTIQHTTHASISSRSISLPQIWTQSQATRDEFFRGRYLTFRDVYVDDCPKLDLGELCSRITINNQLIVFGG